MKFGFTFKDITIGDKATIGEVSVNMQYDAKELVEEYSLVRKIVKEIPEIVADLGAGFTAFDAMDKAFDDLATARYAEDATEESKQSAINKVMEVIKSFKVDNTGKPEEKEVK